MVVVRTCKVGTMVLTCEEEEGEGVFLTMTKSRGREGFEEEDNEFLFCFVLGRQCGWPGGVCGSAGLGRRGGEG